MLCPSVQAMQGDLKLRQDVARRVLRQTAALEVHAICAKIIRIQNKDVKNEEKRWVVSGYTKVAIGIAFANQDPLLMEYAVSVHDANNEAKHGWSGPLGDIKLPPDRDSSQSRSRGRAPNRAR